MVRLASTPFLGTNPNRIKVLRMVVWLGPGKRSPKVKHWRRALRVDAGKGRRALRADARRLLFA